MRETRQDEALETVIWIGSAGTAQLLATLGLLAVLVAIAAIDLRSLRIPDALSLPLVAAGLAVAPALRGTAFADHAIGAVAAFGLFALIGELHFRRRGTEGLGLGDAKLFAAGGAWLGWQALPMVLLIAALGGLAGAAVRGRDRPLAFGPWLAAGIAVLWLYPSMVLTGGPGP